MKFERRALLRATTAATLVTLHPGPAWPSSYTSVGVPGYGVNREYALVTTAAGTRCLVCCDPSVDRGYFAACVSCGSLDDGPIEGLAHLAEHMTLASDPAGLASFIDGRQGEVNAFTGERTTTFYAQFDLDSERGLDVEIGDGLRRFAALFAAARSELPKKRLLRQEISRVDAEMRDILRAPSRGLVEVASLKARTEAASTWSRLGRGDATTLRAGTDAEARELAGALGALRAARYSAASTTVAIVSPLPIDAAKNLVGTAFSAAAAAPATPGVVTNPLRPLALPDLGVKQGGAMAMVGTRGSVRPRLCLAWSVAFDDPVAAAREKPLALLGHALTEPHAGSLAAALRSRGLAPLEVAAEPVVGARTVAAADDWAIWQLDITLAENAAPRWREAVALATTAVSRLARRGVPSSSVEEAIVVSSAAWRWSSRPPTAIELASDLQFEPTAPLAVTASRSFVGSIERLAAAATACAAQLASRPPTATLWATDASQLQQLGVETAARTARAPALPPPLGDIDVKLVPLLLQQNPPPALLPGELEPPPPNPWVPTAFTPASRATAVRLGYRFDAGLEDDDPADRPGGRGFGRLQLPGCVDLTEVAASWRGSKLALADVLCSEGSDRKPFATAAVQLCSDRPAAATTTARQRARAELWRMTLLQALSSSTAAAARAGLKVDVSFNARGVRLLVSGYAQRLPQMVDLALRRTLRHAASEATAPELEAARRAAAASLGRKRDGPAARDAAAARDELARVKLIDVNQEIRELFGSVTGVQLLLAGAIDYAAAEAAAASVRQQVAPLLQSAPPPAGGREALPDVDFADELATWEGLLYKPEWSPLPLAGNLCVDPAISTCLDQCGGI